MKILSLFKGLLPFLAVCISYLVFAALFLFAVLGRAFFEEGNLTDILAACLDGRW